MRMKMRLLLVAVMAMVMTLFMIGQAFACSSPCPPKQNCIQVCMPELW